MGAHGFRVPQATVWASASAVAATVALRPRRGLIDPAPVEATAYFSADEIDRARSYQRPQRALALAGMAVDGGAIALIALRPPRRVGVALERAGARPIAGAAAAGAAGSLGLGALTLPLAALRHRRAVAAGISVQSWAPWLGDVAKASGIGALLNGGALAGTMALVRRFPGRWWLPAAAGAGALSAGFILLSPVLLDPVFNRFEPLPDGELRTEVLALAERAGVEVGEVYRVDASRRTTAGNAYVTGLGRTKRVVLFDTLLRDFPPAEVRSVVAHELSHVRHRDVQRALAWLALAAPAGMHLAQRLSEWLAAADRAKPGRRMRSRGLRPGRRRRATATGPGPQLLPPLVLALGAVSFAGGLAANALSRRVEARADAFALDLTEDPDAFISLDRRLALKALADPQPRRLLQKLFGTHPDAVTRIGYAVAWRDHRARSAG